MPWYSINTRLIIDILRHLGARKEEEGKEDEVIQVWLADDSAAGGRINKLYKWYSKLIDEGKKYGYHVKKAG